MIRRQNRVNQEKRLLLATIFAPTQTSGFLVCRLLETSSSLVEDLIVKQWRRQGGLPKYTCSQHQTEQEASHEKVQGWCELVLHLVRNHTWLNGGGGIQSRLCWRCPHGGHHVN